MKKKMFILLLLTVVCFGFQNIDGYRKVDTRSFAKGEKITYLAHYGFVNAGRATVQMDSKIYTRNGRPCYKVDVDGWTVGMFALGYKVKDKWRSYIDTSAVISQQFYRDISENKYRLEETAYFDQHRHKVRVKTLKNGKNKDNTFDIPAYAQDLVSGYYYLRTIDFENLKVGDMIKIDGFFENKVYDFNIKYKGTQVVKTKFGKINAYKLEPIMPDNKLFEGEDAILFYVSADQNRIPLKIRAKMFVGAFEIDMVKYEGLKSDFNWAKKK
ncbi:MAG: DUF3108 domain-containing protein [Flammeovirgaceae bacterium]